MMGNLGRAIEIAATAHAGQEDKSGRPYILHPLYVMNKVKHLGDNFMIAAILHDVVEDTDWTIGMIKGEGFHEDCIFALMLLTHNDGSDYDTYIRHLSSNTIARAVKLADLEHNLKPTRLKGLRKKDHERIEKYHRAFTYLRD